MLFKLLSSANPQEAIDFACALGAIVATNTGTNPTILTKEIYNFMNHFYEAEVRKQIKR